MTFKYILYVKLEADTAFTDIRVKLSKPITLDQIQVLKGTIYRELSRMGHLDDTG